MRDDMYRVVTERPGHRNKKAPNNKTGGRLPKDAYDADDHGRSRLGFKDARDDRDWHGRGCMPGPLKGFLKKNVGRPWSKVYGDICATTPRRSDARNHLVRSIEWMVDIDCFKDVDGVIRKANAAYGGGHPEAGSYAGGFYVHPITGLLCKAKRKPTTFDMAAFTLSRTLARYELPTMTLKERLTLRGRWEMPAPKTADWIIVNQTLILERREGNWYAHAFKALDPFEKVGTKTVSGREVDVLRVDLKGCLYQKLHVETIGRKHPLWDRCKEHA